MSDDPYAKGAQDAKDGNYDPPWSDLSVGADWQKKENEEYEKGFQYTKGQLDAHDGVDDEPWPGMLEINPINEEETEERRQANASYRAGRKNAEDNPRNDEDDGSSIESSELPSASYSCDSDCSRSSPSSFGLGKFLLLLLVIGTVVAFLSNQSDPVVSRPYSPPPSTPSPEPAPRQELSTDGRELLILRGTWPRGATPTKTILIPDPRAPNRTGISEALEMGDDLQFVFEPFWVMNLETVGLTIEMAVDEGDGFKSLTELTQAHALIPSEQGRPWLAKRRIIRVHRTNESDKRLAYFVFGIERWPESRVTARR